MKDIILSGPDGTGKTTVAIQITKSAKEKGFQFEHVWLRFNHYTSKIINFIGRFLGKSYYENYPWGKIGYHDYHGLIGFIYILSNYIDFLLFRILFKPKRLSIKGGPYLIDRYILDLVADLIVDTRKEKMVLILFSYFLNKEIETRNAFIFYCPKEVVFSRRPDIIDDKKYDDKIKAYKIISNKFNIPLINTHKNSIEEIVQIILQT